MIKKSTTKTKSEQSREEQITHPTVQERKVHGNASFARPSGPLMDRNQLSRSKTTTPGKDAFRHTLPDKDLKEIANLFLSNASTKQEDQATEYVHGMSQSLLGCRKQGKKVAEANAISETNSVRKRAMAALSEGPCEVKSQKRRTLDKSTGMFTKKSPPKSKKKHQRGESTIRSGRARASHENFFISLEGGGRASEEEALSREVLQQTVTFLAKMKASNRRRLWNLREVAQGTGDGKDILQYDATDKYFLNVLTKGGQDSFAKAQHKSVVSHARSSASTQKAANVYSDDESNSDFGRSSSSSEPGAVSDSDSQADMEKRAEHLDDDSERGSAQEGTQSNTQREQPQNGGRLFTQDDTMWSD